MPALSSLSFAHSGVFLLLIQSTTLPVGSLFSLKSGAFGLRLFDVLFHHSPGWSSTDCHLSSTLLSLVCIPCFNTLVKLYKHAICSWRRLFHIRSVTQVYAREHVYDVCSMCLTKYHLVHVHVTRHRRAPQLRCGSSLSRLWIGVRLSDIHESAGRKMLPYQEASWHCRLLPRHHIVGTAPFSTRRRCLFKGILGLTPSLQLPHFFRSNLKRHCILGRQTCGLKQANMWNWNCNIWIPCHQQDCLHVHSVWD